MEVEELYSKSQEKYHGNCNCKKFCTTCDDKYNYHHLYASQDLLFRVNHAPRTPRTPKTITIFKNGKFRKYAYFKGFNTLIKKYILSNETSNSSLPNFRKAKNKYDLSSKSKSNEEITSKKLHPFRVNLIVNTVTGTEHFYYSANTFGKPCWKIYRCQFNTQEESCCCSCNSDAMFEVMKSLYDCYKKKNCDHCNCILCGHLPREERRLGEIRKSVPELKAISAVKSKKIKKIKGKKIKDVTSLLKDKSPEEKENILRDLVNAGAILPEGKTKSEKELIQKVEAERMIPEEKKISEKILEERIKSEALISKKRIPSEKLRKAKEEGLLTPLEGKTPKQKEKILKGLAMNGIPLPTAKTPSTKKIIDKVRKEMGLPPEPLTADDKQKYKIAMETGLITPLEGKSPSEKERILQGLAATGVPLPEARTSSEKALITKIKEQIPTEIAIKPEKRKPISRALMEVKTLSDKLRKAKAEGLLTPLEGKTDEQKRKILKELVKNHIPLPEGKTASEKKIIDQVHEEMGLPPQPKTPSTKEKYQEAIKAGLVTPLEGKTTSEKEKVLTDLAALGVELPVGRTSSEKALIAKVKEKVPVVGEILVRPERKLTKPGVLPSLRGKTPEEKEQLLKNFAINNIPLPEGKSPSEKVLIDKIRADIGLPPEPKSKSEKGIYKQAQAAGLIVPLEGKTQSEKEKILQGQADLGLELPQGRTASEKSLINKIKKGKKKKVKTRDKGISPPALPPEKRKKLDTKTLKVMKESKGPSDECICGLLTPESERLAPESLPSIKIPSEKLKAAKAAGLLTPLEGKTPSQKEKILKNLAKTGIPLPEPKTASEKKILEKVQNDLGLPPTPLTPSLKEKYAKAQVAGIITPLEGKTPSQKEKILNKQAEMGLNLPVGRTPSEKALIDKIRTGVRTAEIPSEKIRKYSLEGKTPEEKEKILKNLAKAGLPLPEGKTPSEKAIVKKVKEAAGLPMVSPPASERLRKAKAAGLLTPLEGKTPAQKEDLIKRHLAAGIPLPEPKTASEKKIIKDVIAKSSKLLHGKTLSQKEKILKNIAKQGLPLPEPKTASDKAIVDKIRAEATPSLKLREAHAAGLMTPLQGKTNDEKEKILKGLVKAGIPLPEATSPSEKKVFEKVRYDLGLPPEPKSLSIKEKMHQAQVAGIITPLEGKTPAQKEKVLKKMHEAGIPLPKGKTKSEKSMIKKIKGEVVSEKLKEAKVKGLITPLEGKTPEQKEKILRKLAKSDMPLPEGKTPSEKALVAKIKTEVGIVPKLPPPELPEKIKKLDKKTAKIMKEGKGPSDECICGLLTPKPVAEILPVQKIPSEKMLKAKAAGLLTPLEGKSPEQKEKILKGLAMREIPLPEPKTTSEKRLHDKVRADLGMTPQPKTPSAKIKYNDAVAAGLIAPLEGKTPSQKEKILKGQAALGIPLPEGRTPSETALIAKVKAAVPVPVGEVLPIKKIPSEKVRKAKAAGLLTPLEGKSPEQKEKILKGLAMHEIPLPEPKTASEKRLHDKVRADLGMTPQPKTPSAKIKYKDAVAAGLIAPLEGKTPSQKEKILKGQAALGIPLPEGRTPSEKALIAKVKAAVPVPVGEVLPIKKVPSEKMRKAKAAGLLTPLEGKSPEQKEKILKGLAMHEIPLPEPKTASEKRLHDKVRADLGMSPQPKTPSAKIKYKDAVAAGLIAPLEGKTPSQKEKILKGQAALGIPLPEGRTPSEKALIAKVKTAVPVPVGEVVPIKKVPSEKVRKAKAAGLLTPLEDKTPEQKEKILKGLAMHEIPLPEPKTASEKRLHDKVRADLGMTPQPKTPSAKIKYNDAVAAGLIAPLEGKSPSQKEKILKGQAALGIPLPEGRTPSEKALIAKIKASAPKPEEKRIPVHIVPSDKLRKAKEAGLLTPLEGKTPEQKEKILKELALHGIPLPEPKTASESKVIDKVVAALGMPPQPKTSSEKLKYKHAAAAGLITPLQGKSKPQKEKILRGQAQLGLPLPEGRTTSEKALIAKIKSKPKSVEKISRPALPPQKLAKLDKKTAKVMKESKKPSDECICDLLTPETERGLKEAASIVKIPSKKLQKAKAAGLLTPLQGKTAKQKEKILKDLAMQGIPLPEATTSSEKKLFAKVRDDIGLPPEPKTSAMKQKYDRALADNIIIPLEGKTKAEKEKVLRKQAALGLPLPVGRTPSEKALIAKVEKEAVPSEKLRKAKAAGLLTPLEGKTPQQKEKILQGLAEAGLPLPEGKTTSEIALIQKIKPKSEVAPKFIATEKEKVKTKSRKVGVPKSKGGIIEEFQDIVKTTTCDKGCGCDKKKIRFKHSYVKIRVTSPDISSLCPCPEECLPGVKGGVFTDNEGIKVTVGRVTCIPSNHSRKLNGNDNYEENYKYCSTLTRSTTFKNCTNKKKIDSKSESDISLSRRSFLYNSDYYLKKNIAFVDSYLCRYSGSSSTSVQNVLSTDISFNSFNSKNFLKTKSSVSLITLPSSVSVWSFSATSHSTSNCSDKESSLMKNYIDNYDTIRNILLPRQNKGNISYSSLNTNEYRFATHKEIQIYRASDVNNNVFDNKLNSARSGSKHIIYVDEIDNKNEIAKLLKKTISETNNLYNSSSLFIIVSSSSDSSSDYCSSTICLDLSETHSIWNPGTSGLHHLREKQKGFKISTRGNVRDLDNSDNLLSPQPREIAENLLNPKKYDKLLHRNNCKRIVSTDTTEDRPCCCEVNNINSDHRDVRVQRSDRIVSEFLKPMILKDVVNQGFSHDYYMLDLPDTPKSSYSSPHHSNRCEPTPVRLCKLPPCNGHNLCHDNEQMKKRHFVHPNDVSPATPQFYKSCDCSTDKLIKLFEKNAKQLVSIACGDSNDDLRKGCNKMERRKVQMPYEITSELNKCSSCTSSKSNLQPIIARDNKKYSCPCEEHQKVPHMDVYSREFDSTTFNRQNNCQCPDRPQKKKHKNIVCECPEEPELEFDISDWFDEKQLRKMQSDLTQTTSGFKIQIPRKKSDSEVSFEEALRYYAENLENIDDEKCGCKDKSKKKSNARCECQYEPPPPLEHAEPISEPFTGIKFRIDGKGTASKGLSGILCFE